MTIRKAALSSKMASQDLQLEWWPPFTLSPLWRIPTFFFCYGIKRETLGNTLSGPVNSSWVLRGTHPPRIPVGSGVSQRSTHWGGREDQAGKASPTLPLEHTLPSSSPSSEFGQLPELFPRVVSSLACRQVWMFCQHSREFMIACRCVSKNTLYPEQKLMQA